MTYPDASCATCGAPLPDGPVVPASWSLQVTARGRQWLCPGCTRDNIRGIEARLDEAWW